MEDLETEAQMADIRAENRRASRDSSRPETTPGARLAEAFEHNRVSVEQDMAEPGMPVLRAFDALMVLYPKLQVTNIDLQAPDEDHPEGGPWAVVEFEDHPGFAVWKRTGAIHRMTYFGAVEDDPLLTWDDDGMPTIGRLPL